ncbi:MAG: flagellar biosynthetic protein FliR [Planctomycetota bacterium]
MPVTIPTALIEMHLVPWLLVLFRLSGVFLLSPILGSGTIPRYVKALLVFILSLCVYPVLLADPGSAAFAHASAMMGQSLGLWQLLPVAALELLLGYIVGYTASLPLIGMQVGGNIIDQQLGLAFAQIVNPELGESSSVIAEFLFMTALALFVIVGGHYAMLAVLIGSFSHVPLGGFHDISGLVAMTVGLLGVMFELAIKVSAPVLCLMFLQSVAMGFIARTVPQMNILSVGFSIRILAGSVMLITSIGVITMLYRDSLLETMDALMHFMSPPSGPES